MIFQDIYRNSLRLSLTVHTNCSRRAGVEKGTTSITGSTRSLSSCSQYRWSSERRKLNIYQALLAKSLHGENGIPLTRADWYRQQSARQSESALANAQATDRFADNGNQQHTNDDDDRVVQGLESTERDEKSGSAGWLMGSMKRENHKNHETDRERTC